MKVAHWLLAVAVAWWLRQGGAPAVPRDCQHRCGDVVVPYPFGLDPNCARSSDFVLSCTNTEGKGIQLLVGSLWIREISVGDSTMVVSLPEVYECYDQSGTVANESGSQTIDLAPNPRFSLSAQNNLTVLGCDVMATVADAEGTFGTGCISYCGNNPSSAKLTTCSGQGCCQASIPRGLKKLKISIALADANANASASRPNGCGVAFVADKRLFNSSNWTLPSFGDVGKGADLRLDWTVEPDVACDRAGQDGKTYACGNHTKCLNVGSGPGYKCVCNEGYEGNPYNLRQGCTDINECKDPKRYPCRGKCKNLPGSYRCYCPLGKRFNRRNRCQVSPLSIALGVIVLSFFGITSVALLLVHTWRRRRKRRMKQKNFRRNGGELLKRQRVKIFTEAELAKATNNYDDSNKLGEGGFGSVYRGRVAGDTDVAVKKPKDVHKSLVQGDFHQELETVMQMNHKNVVKLHGICLETKIPLLVYEYISNGNLFQHIHQNASTFLRSWKNRLRIAAEAALALEYMHLCAEPPIIHGYFKSANILLDRNYSVKVSDFGTSVLVSPEHNCRGATEIQGTLGYIDPEYLTTSMLTIKSDVYSFGAVLVELLTGKKPTSFVPISGESINIIHYFISSGTDKRLSDVINFEAASKDEMEKVGMVAEIAVKCLDQSSAKRPAMREVAEQLVRINHELYSSTVDENNEATECKVDEENLYSHATSVTCEDLANMGMDLAKWTGEHGTSGSLF